ncbi:serpin B10 isoform X2 [Monodelphis domestica]|uniref:serpin B10 isoform X2 n=1 Tax=Monodelphis domestica TaxID=13616 RepID=UPI0024E26309|nr:serpin B10 isoform X2 [Monodelphis domestica]
MDSLAISNNQFAIEMFKKLSESSENENIIFSSLSISSSLAMIFFGAKSNTATQMEQVLQLKDIGAEITSFRYEKRRKTELGPSKAEGLLSDFQALLSEINKPSDSHMLKIANRSYGEKTYPFRCEYMENIKKFFGAEPQSVNFLETPDQIRSEINTWVENQTEGKIVKLLPDDSVDSMTRLVLVSAIYFKGKWQEQFKPKDTVEKPFRVNQLEKTITYGKLSDWTHEDMMEKYDVQLYLPKFKLEENYDLKSILSSMGMSDAFSTSHADFSGMTEMKNLFLSEVFHKAFVEVNEEGTEAAASTAEDFSVRMKLPSLTFNVDHPFLFFIKHKKTNCILFYGKVYSP